MGIHAQPVLRFAQATAVLDLPTAVIGSEKIETGVAPREPTALRSAFRLLAEAGRVLSGGEDAARKYIVRAAALLQAESDFRERDAGHAGSATQGRLAPWQVNRVVRFIEANLSEKIGPRDFAGLVRLSTNHFAQAFRATVGEPPYAYLIRRRIERAKEMMLETEHSLAHIALECGFADQQHLTRLFTRMVGVSPAAWRRAHVATADVPHSDGSDHEARFLPQAGRAA